MVQRFGPELRVAPTMRLSLRHLLLLGLLDGPALHALPMCPHGRLEEKTFVGVAARERAVCGSKLSPSDAATCRESCRVSTASLGSGVCAATLVRELERAAPAGQTLTLDQRVRALGPSHGHAEGASYARWLQPGSAPPAIDHVWPWPLRYTTAEVLDKVAPLLLIKDFLSPNETAAIVARYGRGLGKMRSNSGAIGCPVLRRPCTQAVIAASSAATVPTGAAATRPELRDERAPRNFVPPGGYCELRKSKPSGALRVLRSAIVLRPRAAGCLLPPETALLGTAGQVHRHYHAILAPLVSLSLSLCLSLGVVVSALPMTVRSKLRALTRITTHESEIELAQLTRYDRGDIFSGQFSARHCNGRHLRARRAEGAPHRPGHHHRHQAPLRSLGAEGWAACTISPLLHRHHSRTPHHPL